MQLSQQVVQLKYEWLEGQYGFTIEDHLQRPAAAGLSLMSCLGPRLAFAKDRGLTREWPPAPPLHAVWFGGAGVGLG